MFGSLVVLQEFTVLDCAMNPLCIHSIYILPLWCVCFSVLHPKLFSLPPRAASKEPGIGSPFVFANLSPHLCCAAPGYQCALWGSWWCSLGSRLLRSQMAFAFLWASPDLFVLNEFSMTCLHYSYMGRRLTLGSWRFVWFPVSDLFWSTRQWKDALNSPLMKMRGT